MTTKLFWQYPYLSVLSTAVETVAGDWVTLRETIFYVESGGQESDAGTIGGYPVLEAHKSGFNISYRLPLGHGLQPADAVVIEIDWSRRYRLMRLHFGAEIILALIYQHFPGIEKIGAHISAEKARIDFSLSTSIAPHLPGLTGEARKLIDQDMPILSDFSDESRQLRYWEISGFAKVPCGGTHLRRTGEIGGLLLKRKNIGKGKERVEVYLVD